MEFVKVNYPRQRRVLLDGEDFEDTNTTFEVERGTHTFAIDEPTVEDRLVEFIDLTSQQSPRVLTFTPALDRDLGVTRAAPEIAGAGPVRPAIRPSAVKKAPPKKTRPARVTKSVTKKGAVKKTTPAPNAVRATKSAAKKTPVKKGAPKKGGRK